MNRYRRRLPIYATVWGIIVAAALLVALWDRLS
jgi:hypothetical protein